MYRSSRRRPAAAGSRGFTLIEMLLAVALSLALLGGLWQLFRTYADLFEQGQERVETSQLVRSVMQLFTDDLGAAIQDPVFAEAAADSATAPQRRFGLNGTASELRVDILKLIPQRGNPNPVGAFASGGDPENLARVPELRTVVYSFAPVTTVEDSEQVPRGGLIRREMDFETPVAAGDAGTADPLGGQAEDDWAALDESPRRGSDAAESEVDPLDDSAITVPEVRSLSFRYFDGRAWSSSWSSLQRKSLPVAVEISLGIRPPTAASRADETAEAFPGDTVADQPLLDEPFAEQPEADSGDQAPAATVVQRLVVELPGSPSYQKLAESPRGAKPAVRSVRPRRIAPRRWQAPSPPGARRGPDQWIRTSKP